MQKASLGLARKVTTLFFPTCILVCVVTSAWSCRPSALPEDPYATVAPVCGYLPLPEERTLRPQCSEALAALLPIDEASFVHAPTGMRDKMLESFHALLAYPLEELRLSNSLFGARSIAGIFPQAILEILQGRGKEINRSLFNYVVRRFEQIQYDDQPSSRTATASINLTPGVTPRILNIHRGFWDAESPIGDFHSAFFRASTLLHEARHADGWYHVQCPRTQAPTPSVSFVCDADLTSTWGLKFAYLLGVLRAGSRPISPTESASPPPTPPLRTVLRPIDQYLIATLICDNLPARVLTFPAPLRQRLQEMNCDAFSLLDFLALENLPQAVEWTPPSTWKGLARTPTELNVEALRRLQREFPAEPIWPFYRPAD
jgi:hypothetical protein